MATPFRPTRESVISVKSDTVLKREDRRASSRTSGGLLNRSTVFGRATRAKKIIRHKRTSSLDGLMKIDVTEADSGKSSTSSSPREDDELPTKSTLAKDFNTALYIQGFGRPGRRPRSEDPASHSPLRFKTDSRVSPSQVVITPAAHSQDLANEFDLTLSLVSKTDTISAKIDERVRTEAKLLHKLDTTSPIFPHKTFASNLSRPQGVRPLKGLEFVRDDFIKKV